MSGPRSSKAVDKQVVRVKREAVGSEADDSGSDEQPLSDVTL